MRRTGCLLLLCLITAACGSDEGAETPEVATTKFLEALQSGDQEDIYDSIAGAEMEGFARVDERLDFNRWDECNIEEFAIKGVEFRGNRAYVTVLVTREVEDVDTAAEESVVCLQEHGLWKVTISQSSKSFLPSGKKPE